MAPFPAMIGSARIGGLQLLITRAIDGALDRVFSPVAEQQHSLSVEPGEGGGGGETTGEMP